MDPRFERFTQERKYLHNVSPATIDWHTHSLNWLPMLRDVKLRCQGLGIVSPVLTIHAFRHTFAVNYLRKRGSVFHL